MPTSLTFDEHLGALQSAGTRMVDLATSTGLDADVPTCPSWDVRALLAHQTMVHRWATAVITGGDADAVPNQTTIRSTVDDLIDFTADGLHALIDALRTAPPDLEAMTFLNDAPAPREFWARRQAHETTVHGIDALAASVGRTPTESESAISAPLAVDGLDELLRGFFTRGKSKLDDGNPFTFVVDPSDVDEQWIVRVDGRLTVDRPGSTLADPTATLTGTAAGLYLSLWNRGDEVTLAGRDDVMDRWRAAQRVRWS